MIFSRTSISCGVLGCPRLLSWVLVICMLLSRTSNFAICRALCATLVKCLFCELVINFFLFQTMFFIMICVCLMRFGRNIMQIFK